MLLSFMLIVALHLTAPHLAADFLEDGPQRIDDDQVVYVLRTFYNDLEFVRAITESRQSSGYDELIEEVEGAIRSPDVRDQVQRGAAELFSGNWFGFTRTFSYNWESICSDVQGQSYCYYLTSELNRLRGSTNTYLLKNAMRTRQRYKGVSINELARLDGLIVLQIASQFNHQVDWLYGIRQSPNFELLSSVHTVLKDESTPFNDIRSAILERLFRTPPLIGIVGKDSSSGAVLDFMQRTDPHIDNFRNQGPTIARASVKGILYELAERLSILGVSPLEETDFTAASDYSPVIDQAKRIDTDFARELRENVVDIFDQDPMRAIENVEALLRALDGFGNSKSKQSFLKYFEVELRRRSTKKCNMDTLSEIEMGLVELDNSRRSSKGVSLGNIVELKGKVVFLQLKCFHARLKLTFKLSGYDTEQQLKAKRTQFGSSDRLLPVSDLVYF